MAADSDDPRFAALHDLLLDDLVALLKSKAATAADRAMIAKFLKDAGITAAPIAGSKMADLSNKLRDYDGDEHTH